MVDITVKARQETGSFCGPAVIETLLGHLGRKVSQLEVVEACEAKTTVMKDGISLVGLAKGVKKLFPDLQVWEKQNSSISDIYSLVEHGYPVAVDWQGVFTTDEYGDEIWNTRDKFRLWLSKVKKEPVGKGDQGHYCIVTDVDQAKGYIRFVDPYGHYAGKDRFLATWEFEERWWDDRIGIDQNGKKSLIIENKLMFVIVPITDTFIQTMGMSRV
jgi:hypothetical protein